MNCIRTGQDFYDWKLWGSHPNRLEMLEFESKEEENKMKLISEKVINGYVKERIEEENIPSNLMPPQYLLGIISKYFKAPVARYSIVWRYEGSCCDTPMTSDSDAPDWKEDGDEPNLYFTESEVENEDIP